MAIREGKLLHIDLKQKKLLKEFVVPSVAAVGQGGLLDLKKHPKFNENNLILYTFSKVGEKKGYTTVLSQFRWNKNQPKEYKELYTAKAFGPATRHFGSRIAFNDKKDKVFISIGDRGEREKAQLIKFDNGKILRLNLDGSMPADNPFQSNLAVWSYGHRNPQGLFYHMPSKTLFEQEHGPRGGDEINIIKPGKNYGWPVITYGKEYWGPSIGEGQKKKGMEQPIKYYVPSIAPCGLIYYEGSKYPSLKNSLLSGALKLKHLNQISVTNKTGMKKKKHFTVAEERRHFESLSKRVRYITLGPKENLYFTTDDGAIYQIQ